MFSNRLFSLVSLLLFSDALGAENNGLRGLQDVDVEPDAVPDEYIIVMKGGVSTSSSSSGAKVDAQTTVSTSGGSVVKDYSYVLNGFVAKLSPEGLRALSSNPNIDYIDRNLVVSVSDTQTEDLPWGLDRIDQPFGRDGSYTFEETGVGVHAYVIDTGVDSTHDEFSGRLGNGYNARQGDNRSPQPWDDCHGHGTHVASTVGGTKYGVAKEVTLHGVRVLGCSGSGSYADVIEGMDWVTKEHINGNQKSVANMSLGGGFSSSVNAAVQSMVDAGIVVAVAAGNNNGNACNRSPASAANAVTVAATTTSDARASFSNFGSCVDIFAPGQGILGAWYNCNDCTRTISGTSMASPHVAGVAALFLENSNGSPAEILEQILDKAVDGIVSGANGSPNELLQSTTAPGDSPTDPPQASPTDPPPTDPPQASPTNPPQAPPTDPPQASPTDPPQASPTPAPASSPTPAPFGFPTCRITGEDCISFSCPNPFCCCDGLVCSGQLFGQCI